MIKNICTVILLLLSVLPAAGQNRVKVKISGNVITADGAPAEYITVSLKNTVFGGMSDGDGNFEFAAPPGEYTMVVQSVTAHRKEFPVTIETGRENVFPNIEVKEDINQLEEVVVTGQFSPQSMKNSLYKVRSVNSDQIRQKAPLDVQSLLNTEIGIRLSNDMALGETDFELMGMSGNNVKILMDGIPMIDRGSTKQSLSQLDVNRIERVEIVEGPMSVVYGTDALAGVINIITKKGPGYSGESTWRVGARIQEETRGKEYQFFNGEGLHNESIDLGFNLKNGLYFNGGYTRNDNGGWQGDLTGREKRWHPKDQSLANGMIGFQRRNLNVWYRLDFLEEKIFGTLNGTRTTSDARRPPGPTSRPERNGSRPKMPVRMSPNTKPGSHGRRQPGISVRRSAFSPVWNTSGPKARAAASTAPPRSPIWHSSSRPNTNPGAG